MSQTRTARIPPVVYVDVSENFEKAVVWDRWGGLIEEGVQPFIGHLTRERGWTMAAGPKGRLNKRMEVDGLTLTAELDVNEKRILLRGSSSSRVIQGGEASERRRVQTLLERTVLEAEVGVQEDLHQALESAVVGIESSDHYCMPLEWENIMGRSPDLYMTNLFEPMGWSAQDDAPDVYVKPLGDNSRVRLDLREQSALIQSSRQTRVGMLEKNARSRELQQQMYDEIERVKDQALVELNGLKQGVYKEILMDFAKSRGHVSVSTREDEKEYNMVIEITPEVQ